MGFGYNWHSGFEEMFEIVIILESWVKGQTITLTSSTLKS